MRVVDSLWIQGRQLVNLDESALESESLLSEVLPAFVPHILLALSSLLLLPVAPHFHPSLLKSQATAATHLLVLGRIRVVT
jgi:hypothetical protein